MEMKVQVPFQQLLTIVKTLTPAQKAKLRKELNEEKAEMKNQDDFIQFLLTQLGNFYPKIIEIS